MSSQATSTSPADFKSAVALQFASRPTLRDVTGQQLIALLLERHPILSTIQPALTDAEPFLLQVPQASGSRVPCSLLQVVLQAMLDGEELDLGKAHGRDHYLSLASPYGYEDSGGGNAIALNGINDAINDLILELPAQFRQAQVAYWQGMSSAGVSRDRWLQQTVKSALLRNLSLQELDAQQQACVRGLLKGSSERPAVFTVEAVLQVDGERFLKMLPNLLLVGEWDERTVVLWCSPSSVIKTFDSLEAFALTLRDDFAERYRFDSMSWNRYELEGDAFAQQAALLLETMLDSGQKLRQAPLASVAELEQVYDALSDPSQWFIEGYIAISDASVKLPPGLHSASAGDSFAYQCALFDLALAQAESEGAGSLDDVQDLHSFASQRLREQLLADHPIDANYFPDDLNLTLTVARGIPGGAGVGVGGGVVETRTITLTEFAIGNLSSLGGANLTGIAHRDNQLIMDWMTVDYARSLVEQVDIGGQYPDYVAQKLDDEATREQRVKCFAREWRCSLLFSALSAKLGATLSEAGLQCVVDYCRGDLDPDLPGTMLMPLAFKREPTASDVDVASGMYVLFSVQPAVVLLYRPLYSNAPLKEFVSLEAMMTAIREPGALQDSILAWMASEARSVYDYNGFSEPHLGRPILDTSLPLEPVEPASFAAQFWRLDVDAKLYKANRDLLVELADQQSVSNAESRWALFTEGAWLLFDVVTLLLRGPVATLAWLVQAIHGVKNDLLILTQGSAFERSAAVVDLILNLGMALFHARLPKLEQPEAASLPGVGGFDGPPVRNLQSEKSTLLPTVGKFGLPGSLGERPNTHLDFAWRARQGFNMLPSAQRKALSTMRSAVSVNGLQTIESGLNQGLYSIDKHFYVTLAGDVYEVEVSEQGVRVVGTKGESGPWLSFMHGQWRVDSGLRLLGGAPKRRAALIREENQKLFDGLNTQQEALVAERNDAAESFDVSKTAWVDRGSHVASLQLQRDKVPLDPGSQMLRLAFEGKIASARADVLKAKYQVLEDLKGLIKVELKLDKVLSDMAQSKFAKQELMPEVKVQRSTIRKDLIDHFVALYNDSVSTINTLDVDDLIDNMATRPINVSELNHYAFVRELVERVVGLQFDLVWVSEQLDWLLTSTLKDDDIVFKNEAGTETLNKKRDLEDITAQRKFTYIDLRWRLLEHLSELSLDRKAEVDEELLVQYYQTLWNEEFRSAGSAHGELAALDLPTADRIKVLTGVLKSYRMAQGSIAHLGETGGDAIKADKLKDYQTVLDTLAQLAEEDLAQAIREVDLEERVLPKPRLYRWRSGKHRIVQTRAGQSIIGEEVEVDGVSVVQQRDSSGDNVLKTFNMQDDDWVERVEEPLDEVRPIPNSQNVGAARSSARAALAQVDSVIRLAKQYIASEEPVGMQSVIEEHISKLKDADAALKSTGIEAEFDSKLDEAIERLNENQRILLTSFYLTTSHPTAASLRFLLKEKKIVIKRTKTRVALKTPNDYLDIYEVRRLSSGPKDVGGALWEAHFHYRDATSPARQFVKGHLKIWSQRQLGRQAQLEAARSNSRELLAIYRGNLTLSEVEGVIPFD